MGTYVCVCALTVLCTCVSGVCVRVCLLTSYVVKQWPASVGQVQVEAHVGTKFGPDGTQNDIQTEVPCLWPLDMNCMQHELEF